MRQEQSFKRLIPITALRHFYETLRRFPSFAFRMQAARECLRRPDQLQELVRNSSDHFALYENPAEAFHDRQPGTFSAVRETNRSIAVRLLRKAIAGACSIQEAPLLDFRYVDYEVSPIRTTASQFENGLSGRSSGTGGIDLLLANRCDRVPIIGEVKIEADTDPFFGLIQALMYAVEMTTAPQMCRLNRFYGDQFSFPRDGAFVDVYLMLVAYPNDQNHAESLKMTDELSRLLVTANSPVARIVRRLVCIEAASVDTEVVSFTVRFAHQVGSSITSAGS
jgi:hypothetical protein